MQPFDRFWWNLARWRILVPYSGSTVKILNFWKFKMAAADMMEIKKNRDISATVWPIFTKFDTLVQNGLLTALTVKKSNFTNPRWRTAAILKTVKSPYLCSRSTDFDEIWHDDAYWPPTVERPLKFRIFENSRWRQPPSGKSQKSLFTKFSMLMQNKSLNRPGR